jgi:hypothetical protein
MNGTQHKFLLTLVLLGAIVAVATGWTDSDWQMVTYRYNAWHREQETWEFNPFLKVNWWIAWQLDIIRLVGGSIVIGFLLNRWVWQRG